MSAASQNNWRDNGVRIIPGTQLDFNTPQTPGMTRAAAINRARAGANKLWAGTANIHPNAKTAPHHHGELESIIYVVSGRARMRWGERWSSLPRPGRAILFTCRLLCPIKRSMPIQMNLLCA